MTRGELIELALGKEEARKVDTAIPQGVFNAMTQTARQDIAGWYYGAATGLCGRLLTQTECWTEILYKIRDRQLRVTMMDHDVTLVVENWPCLRQHAERDEVQITEA